MLGDDFMQIDLNESLLLSWLKDSKNCQITQMNWDTKSHHLKLNHIDDLTKILEVTKSFFHENNHICSNPNLLKDEGIRLIGLELQNGNAANFYGVHYSFNDEELIYSQSSASLTPIVEQMIITALLMYGYFNTKQGSIIFVTPILHKNLFTTLDTHIQNLNTVFEKLDFQFTFKVITNDDFKKEVFEPVVSDLIINMYPTELFNLTKDPQNMYQSNTKKETNTSSTVKTDNIDDHTKKIGILVRDEFKKLVDNGLLTGEIIQLLLDGKFSKEVFLLRFPMLKKLNENESILDQRLIKGNGRYYSIPYNINGNRYLLCNDWYEKSRGKFLNWVEALNAKTNKKS